MIAYLKGDIKEKNPSFAIIDVNGIGYNLRISLNTFSQLSEKKNMKLYTHLLIREDQYILYGFYEQMEREMFLHLISINGVGPTMSLLILSSLSAQQISKAVFEEQIHIFQRIKGVGEKIARRIVMELRDKISSFSHDNILLYNKEDMRKLDAISALEVLGFSKNTTEKIVNILLDDNPDISTEKLVRESLRKL